MSYVSTLAALAAAPIVVLLVGSSCFIIWKAIRGARSPLNVLRGPKSPSFIFGHFSNTEISRSLEEWVDQYGDAVVLHGLLGSRRLLTTDPVALHHILSHGNGRKFIRPPMIQRLFGESLGQGLLFAEGDQHRRQRKVISPAFGLQQVRGMTDIFTKKANELRDIWLELASKTTRKDGRVKLDGFSWLNKATLDIIGLAGFDYDFDALHASEEKPNKLYKSFQVFLTSTRSALALVRLSIPVLRTLGPIGTPPERRAALDYIKKAGQAIVDDKKRAVLLEADGRSVGKNGFQKDILSLLIKSNMASDLPDNMRMDDEEIIGQVMTLFAAGHETTSTAVAWTLFALACHPATQSQLRTELQDFPSDTPTMEDLNKLPLLDHVLREVLRLYAPVSFITREVAEDVIVPFGKPILDKNGVPRTEIYLRKGDTVIVPIRSINRSVDMWGEDAQEFKPERWESHPDGASALPSVYSNMLTFNAGPHACIGFRFSVIEAKAIVFAIFRAFEVSLAIQPDDVVRKTAIVGRPAVVDGQGNKVQLPVLIRPVGTKSV